MRIADAIRLCRTLAPPDLALEHDRIGLQLGDQRATLRGILVALDVTRATVALAAQRRCNLIIAHHPLIYQPLKTVTAGTRIPDLVRDLIRHDIALLVMHTNYDAVSGGMNDVLAAKAGLREVCPLQGTGAGRMAKFAVFVPHSHAAVVRDAIGAAGGGAVGAYSHCTFSSPGTGTFRPLAGARPFIGQRGRTEAVAEYRIEALVPQARLDSVIAAVREVHPYEEMAYDVYPLITPGFVPNIGVIGTLPRPLALSAFAAKIRRALKVPRVHLVGRPRRMVRRVAVCAGSASDLIDGVLGAGADVFLTGELKHSAFLDAEHAGLAVVAAGHFHTERLFIPAVAGWLRTHLPDGLRLVMESPAAPDAIV